MAAIPRVDNGMTGARVCVPPCESDTIHGHERACHRTRAGTRKVQQNVKARERETEREREKRQEERKGNVGERD